MLVLVISGSSAFATIVETGGHEVIEARLGDAHAWHQPDDVPPADVALIDIPDIVLATTVTGILRDLDRPPAQVLIEGTDRAWGTADFEVDVSLQPPLSRDTVLAALEAARARRNPKHATTAAVAPDPSARDHDPVEQEPEPASPPTKFISQAVGVGPQAHALAVVAEDVATVAEIAATVTATAVEDLQAQASALMCPNDGEWSVVGGFGTRSLELRASLPPEHWLIDHLLAHRRGAVVDRSDVIRSELTNAPLASREYLVIVSDHTTGCLLMVGRDDNPFADGHLARAHELLTEASPFLLDAIALHDLVVGLERFRQLR